MALIEQQARGQNDRGWKISSLSGSLAALMRLPPLPPLRLPPARRNKLILSTSYNEDSESARNDSKTPQLVYIAASPVEFTPDADRPALGQSISDQTIVEIKDGHKSITSKLSHPAAESLKTAALPFAPEMGSRPSLQPLEVQPSHTIPHTNFESAPFSSQTTDVPEELSLSEPKCQNPRHCDIQRVETETELQVHTYLTTELQPRAETKLWPKDAGGAGPSSPALLTGRALINDAVLEIPDSQIEGLQSEFQEVEKGCYVAEAIQLDENLQDDYDKRLKRPLREALRRLNLPDHLVTMESLMVGKRKTADAMKPTILFMCYSQSHKKAITAALTEWDKIIQPFTYKVVIRKVKKCSESDRPAHLGPAIGRAVEVGPLTFPLTLCGRPARIPRAENGSDFARSTIGGLILIDGTPYALTTAHGFAHANQEDTPSQAENALSTLSTSSSPTSDSFSVLGSIYAYEWTMDDLDNLDDETQDLLLGDHFRNQDWAIITVPTSMYLVNRFRNGQVISNIEEYVDTTDITHGEVYVCSPGIGGIQKGTMKRGWASIFMGHSIFEVKTIFLGHELGMSAPCRFSYL